MLSLAERLKNRGADSEAIAAMSTETKKKIKKRKTSLPFSKSTFLLSSTYTGSAKKKLVGLIKKHGVLARSTSSCDPRGTCNQ